MSYWPWFIFVTIAGACVGSFLNVVIYRLPEGESVVTPPSRCPTCGQQLAWYDNVPVLGWLWLRGRCRYCKTPISVQYPIIEALTALLFAAVFYVDYYTGLRPGFAEAGLAGSWPALIIQLVLVASLVAATAIDARLYIIPLPIPWVATVVAVVLAPLGVAMGWQAPLEDVVPMVNILGIGAAIGGTLGLGVAWGLLQTRMLPRSFDEVEDEVTESMPPDAFLNHPHPRREVLKECLFVVWPVVGALVGMWLARSFATPGAESSSVAQVLGGAVMGYLVGGGLVWFTRILGTLAFGKEAMGLGDVHLLGAIGAAMGPLDAVLIFFVAPFMGLAAALVMIGVTAMVKGQVRVIPYGPYLAGAALVVMVWREPLLAFFGI